MACKKKSPLLGVPVLFVGDSICEAYVESSVEKTKSHAGWAGRIKENTGADGVNRSLGGASLSSVRGENTVINQLLKESSRRNDYKYIVLHGGVNDGWDSVPYGECSKSFDEKDFDFSTYAGGFEKTIVTAKKCFPAAKLLYIINEKTPSKEGKLSDMSGYWAVGKQICDKWEIPYLDLYSIDDISAVPTCNGDHIHPNPEGYDMITPYIQSWLEKQVK